MQHISIGSYAAFYYWIIYNIYYGIIYNIILNNHKQHIIGESYATYYWWVICNILLCDHIQLIIVWSLAMIYFFLPNSDLSLLGFPMTQPNHLEQSILPEIIIRDLCPMMFQVEINGIELRRLLWHHVHDTFFLYHDVRLCSWCHWKGGSIQWINKEQKHKGDRSKSASWTDRQSLRHFKNHTSLAFQRVFTFWMYFPIGFK